LTLRAIYPKRSLKRGIALHADGFHLADSRDAQPVSSARAWFAIAILLLLTILSYVDRSIIALMVGPIERDLGIGDVEISLLQGLAFALFYALASVPMGWISDRVSRRLVIFGGAVTWSLATAASGLATSFGHLFVARIFVGAGEATLSPAAYALTADLFPPRRLSFAIGVLAAGAAIGGALALVIGGLVVHWAETVPPILGLKPWQLVFVIVGLPGLVIAPLIFLIAHVPHVAPNAGALAPAPHYGRWLVPRLGYLIPLSIGAGCQAVFAVGITAWTPAYLQRHFGYDVATIGVTLGIVQGVGGVIGFAGGGWLVDRLGAMGVRNPHSTYLVVAAVLSTIVGVIAYGFVTSVPLLLALLGILYMLMPFTGPALGQLQSLTPRLYRARTVALFMLSFNVIGLMLGPSSVAMLTEYVLGGPEQLGMGLALTIGIFGPVGIVALMMSARAAGPLLAQMHVTAAPITR
jgi:MFS family permease